MSKVFFLTFIGLSLSVNVVIAKPVDIDAEMARILKDHVLIVQAKRALSSANKQLKSTSSDWYPTLAFNAASGSESIEPKFGSETNFDTSEWSVDLNQTLWDFGKTSSAVEVARKQVLIKEAEHNLQVQNLYLAGIEAYLSLKKAYLVAGFARQSEQNIKVQTNLEGARVTEGKGYKVDVLQAKAQLAKVSVERISAEQALSAAKSRYISVFDTPPPSNVDMPMLSLPSDALPGGVDSLMGQLMSSNPDIRLELANVGEARAEGQRVRAMEFFPNLDLVFSANSETNQDGVLGERVSNDVVVRFSWRFSLAGKAFHQVAVAEESEAIQKLQSYYTIGTVQESARNAWGDFEFAKERARYLSDQVQIVGQFLDLARKERELGRRSLIDVLAGETALINARSDYNAAQIDVVIASYNILRNAGRLTIFSVKNG